MDVELLIHRLHQPTLPLYVEIDGEERLVTGVVLRSKPIPAMESSVPRAVVLKVTEDG